MISSRASTARSPSFEMQSTIRAPAGTPSCLWPTRAVLTHRLRFRCSSCVRAVTTGTCEAARNQRLRPHRNALRRLVREAEAASRAVAAGAAILEAAFRRRSSSKRPGLKRRKFSNLTHHSDRRSRSQRLIGSSFYSRNARSYVRRDALHEHERLDDRSNSLFLKHNSAT